MKKKILISTGGSGGHVIPAITIYNHLKDTYETLISTDTRGLAYLDKNYNSIVINTPRLNNYFLLPFSFLKILLLIVKSFYLLKKNNISILISTGGYMSLPICLSAKILGIKIFLIEPNMVLGRANKFFLNFSRKLICYSEKLMNIPSGINKKLTIIKPLIRKEYYESSMYLKKDDLFTIVIIGGSQGAKIFDELLNKIFLSIAKQVSLKIIHQTSEKNVKFLRNFYSKNNIESKVFSFDYNLNEILKQSDLCITRAGASSLAELSILNIPFIAIPLPSSKDNHQYENAKFYKEKDCCWIVDQKNFDEQKFEKFLSELITKKGDYITKKNNLQKLNYQNTWNNVNQKLLKILNEN
ncbi:UDP-N-acetylglucosamine--N-acetylmuramyl-(pentapeptide) pyrophosphoryl-undecaprenol N-acetylglucosamine transferase [Candidatus Pelagibacter sp.]|nr:UDP-N-acetylglucosamine--N-acetylmuramyl-(pentapeptide) pyrophosphoryl-undecaprenol N-acetylglucosamine transferase [Candidatus Pelagibacter sp.]